MRTFCNTQAALLHLEHRLDDQRRPHRLRGLPRVSYPDRRTAGQTSVAAAKQTCTVSRCEPWHASAAHLEDEAQRKGERWRHAEEGDGDAAVEKGLHEARDEQQTDRAAADFFEYLHCV